MFRFSLLLQEGEDPLSATWVHALGSSDGWTLGTVNNTQRYVLKYFIFQYTTSPSMLHNLQHCKQCMSISEPLQTENELSLLDGKMTVMTSVSRF